MDWVCLAELGYTGVGLGCAGQGRLGLRDYTWTWIAQESGGTSGLDVQALVLMEYGTQATGEMVSESRRMAKVAWASLVSVGLQDLGSSGHGAEALVLTEYGR